MPDNQQKTAEKTEELEIARLTIVPEDRYVPAIVDMVADIAKANGIAAHDAVLLDNVLVEIIANIVERGFGGDTRKPVDFIISKRLHSLVVALEDKGLPFDYDNMERGEDSRFKSYMSRGYADEVHFFSLGNRGNRTEIIKNLPARDIRSELQISEHHDHVNAPPADEQEEISIKMLGSGNVHEIVRLVYRCYGYTYPNEFMYFPEQIESRYRADVMFSCGAFNGGGELVGHLAFILPEPGARVAESGEAVVDARYRGHGIFPKMKTYLTDYALSRGVIGVYGEAVTVHPYSQKGSLELGSMETGFLLGYSPGTVSFESISENEKPRRQSIALMFTPMRKGDPGHIHIPAKYEEIIKQIYSNIAYEREFIIEQGRVPVAGNANEIRVTLRHDHNQAVLTVNRLSESTAAEIAYHLKQLRLQRVDCIYADIPLGLKGAGALAAQLRELGFFYGYVIPEYFSSDVLRLQYLNNVEILKEDIKTASPFGQSLLDIVFEDRDSVS